MPEKSFAVVGCHRSATSLVAKGLHEAGVHMGDRLLGPGHGNPEGHYEDVAFLRLNEAMLKEAGGAWNEPPPRSELSRVASRRSEELRATVERASRGPLWGFKDPRTTLLLDAYVPLLGPDPHVVACFRRPEQVARSLNDRDGIPVEEGERLARAYDEHLLRALRGFVEG